jgi:hypothetical protein
LIERYYADYLDRTPAAEELASWLAPLATGAISPTAAVCDFLASDEFYTRV